MIERSPCTYVAHQEETMIMDPNEIKIKSESEFLRKATRGSLTFP